ncbi:MAG: hypothetical protein ACFFCH_11995 [Promethearchaeota archaeon]
MTEVKVAAFFHSTLDKAAKKQWVWERGKKQRSFTSEADLVAAVTYLRMQTRAPIRLAYISKLYVPIYLVGINDTHSLIISGVGKSSTRIKNVTVLPPEAFENLLSHVDKVQQVPSLIANLDKLVKNLYPTSLTLPNVLKSSMIEPIRSLIDPSLSSPSKRLRLETEIDMKAAMELGASVRNEIQRLEESQKHLMHMLDAINQYIEGQLQYINEERLKIHQHTAAELGMAQLLNRLENILKFATTQCRQFIIQMDASPTKTDMIFQENPSDLIQPRILAQDFRKSLQQTSIELDVAFSQLEEAERRWLSIHEQEQQGLQQNVIMSSAPEFSSLQVSKSSPNVGMDSQLSLLVSLRERILGSYPALIQTLHEISSTLETQFNRFMEITAKTDDLRGTHPVVEILIPVYVVKSLNPTRYGVIPPLKFLRPKSPIHWKHIKNVPPVKAFNVDLYNDAFCGTLQDLIRSEVKRNTAFQEGLDKQAFRNNKLKHKKRIDRFLQGVQELSLCGLLSTHLADDITRFWMQLK